MRVDALHVLKQVLASPRRYTRPWFIAYLLLGIVTAGMVPVLLPLMVMSESRELSSVAYVMGAYDVGLLTSPLWGLIAERYKLYRNLFLGGFLVSAAAVAVFPAMKSPGEWMLAAFALGAGSSAAATVASLFIVDFHPQDEWNPRIGMLQSFNGTGQVFGFLLAGIFSHGSFSTGLWLAAALLVTALTFSRMGLPIGRNPRPAGPYPQHILNLRALAVFPHINLPSGIEFHFHGLNMSGIRRLPSIFGTPFARFLLSWFMLALGVAGFFTFFPLMLVQGYGLNSHFSSLIYAGVSAVGIALFILASRWEARFGSGRVYQSGLYVRLVGFILLLVPLVFPLSHSIVCGAIGFALITIAWPALSVAGTGLAAQLSPFSEGAAMGLFNAALALATVIGAFASGPLIAAFGYQALALSGLVGIGFAIVLGRGLTPHSATNADSQQACGGHP